MTAAIVFVGIVLVLWLGRIVARLGSAWRVNRALRRREIAIQKYVMGPIRGSKERQP